MLIVRDRDDRPASIAPLGRCWTSRPLSSSEIELSSLPRMSSFWPVVDDVARLMWIARWPIDEMVYDHFISLPVDRRVRLRRRSAEGEREIAYAMTIAPNLTARFEPGTGRRADRQSAASGTLKPCSRRKGPSPAGPKRGSAWSGRASAALACRNSRSAPTSRVVNRRASSRGWPNQVFLSAGFVRPEAGENGSSTAGVSTIRHSPQCAARAGARP